MTTQKLAYTYEEAAAQCGYSVRILKQAVSDGNLVLRYADTEGVIRHEDLVSWLGQLPTKPNIGATAIEVDPKPEVHRPTGATHLPVPQSESDLLTPQDLGIMLQYSTGTLGNWRSQRRGPEFVRIGGMVRYTRDAVEAWIKAQPSK